VYVLLSYISDKVTDRNFPSQRPVTFA